MLVFVFKDLPTNSVAKQLWEPSQQLCKSVVLYLWQPISHSLLSPCKNVSSCWKAVHDCTAWGLNFLGGKLNWQTTEVTVIFFGTSLAHIVPGSSLYMIGYEALIWMFKLYPLFSLSQLEDQYSWPPLYGLWFVSCVHFLSLVGEGLFVPELLQCHSDCKVGSQRYLFSKVLS